MQTASAMPAGGEPGLSPDVQRGAAQALAGPPGNGKVLPAPRHPLLMSHQPGQDQRERAWVIFGQPCALPVSGLTRDSDSTRVRPRDPGADKLSTSISCRAHSKFASKCTVKVGNISKAAVESDFEHTCRFDFQSRRRAPKPHAHHVLVWGDASEFLERAKKMVRAQTSDPRQAGQFVRHPGFMLDHSHHASDTSQRTWLRSRSICWKLLSQSHSLPGELDGEFLAGSVRAVVTQKR